MVAMKSSEVVLSLAAQLASWRAVLVLVRTWATCKPWQRKDFHQYSIILTDCLNQSKHTVWESAGGAATTESRKVGKGRRPRRYADVDGSGANPEPELGPRGPTLEKQVLKGLDSLDLRPGLQPADSADNTQDFEWSRETAARHKGSFSEEFPGAVPLCVDPAGSPSRIRICVDPAGSPSRIRKVARPSSPSPSATTVPCWRRFFCLGNGK